jgi:hypothetical protein
MGPVNQRRHPDWKGSDPGTTVPSPFPNQDPVEIVPADPWSGTTQEDPWNIPEPIGLFPELGQDSFHQDSFNEYLPDPAPPVAPRPAEQNWRTQYDPQYHGQIEEFLSANPGDVGRIGRALEIGDQTNVPLGPLQPSREPMLGPETSYTHPDPPPNIFNQQSGTGPYTTPPTGTDYGYSLGFRPSDIGKQYGDMTDLEYQQSGQAFPTWESLGTPALDMGDPMSFVQNQPVSGLVPALQEAGYQFRQDPYDTRMSGVPDYNVFYGDQQIPFGLRQFQPDSSTGQTLPPIPPTPPRTPIDSVQSSGEIVRPTTNLPPDWLGDIMPRQDAIPFQPQSYEDLSVIPVGQDPLSQFTNATLASMLSTGGTSPTYLAHDIQATLRDILTGRGQGGEAVTPLGEQVGETASEIIARGGQMPLDVRRRAMEIESARSPLDILRRAQLEQGQAQLADRGLLGQGPEADYMQRLEERLAPEYTRAAQMIELAEREREEQRFQNAMELSARTSGEQAQLRENRLANAMQQASGMSQEQSRNLLNTVASVTERQQMLNDVAISSLDRNMEWNKFIAEFGLERAQVLESIQTGRLAALLPLIQQYLAGTTLAASGFVKK